MYCTCTYSSTRTTCTMYCTMNAAVHMYCLYIRNMIQYQQHCYHPPSFQPMRTRAYNKSAPGRPGNTVESRLYSRISVFLRTGTPPKNMQIIDKKADHAYPIGLWCNWATRDPEGVIFDALNQGNHLPNDSSCALKKKYRLHPDRV